MGAQWKHAGRLQNANKRGAAIGKLVKEIIVAAKIGDPNPANNARLWAAVESARKGSVPRDTIERAIKKGSGQLDDAAAFETITYEGFTPHKVPVIVECLTDNKNRTAADVRVLFRGGQISSVGYLFERSGVVEATREGTGIDIEGEAIEAGAQNVEPLEAEEVPAGFTGARFFCETTDLDSVSKFLKGRGWSPTLTEMTYLAKSPVELVEAEKKEVVEWLGAMDDHDDVHRIYTALK